MAGINLILIIAGLAILVLASLIQRFTLSSRISKINIALILLALTLLSSPLWIIYVVDLQKIGILLAGVLILILSGFIYKIAKSQRLSTVSIILGVLGLSLIIFGISLLTFLKW